MYPGIDTCYPHYLDLLKSAKLIISIIEDKENITYDDKSYDPLNLVYPCILTMCSGFENFMFELENLIEEVEVFENMYTKEIRPKIEERPFVLYEVISGIKCDVENNILESYQIFIGIRNLISHSSGEKISMKRISYGTIVELVNRVVGNMMQRFDKGYADLFIERNEDADLILKYLSRKKIIPLGVELRNIGWLYCLKYVEIAKWCFSVVNKILTLLNDEVGKINNKRCKTFCQSNKQILLLN